MYHQLCGFLRHHAKPLTERELWKLHANCILRGCCRVHVECFTAFISQESGNYLWQSDEENREAGGQNRGSDTETDECKEKDKYRSHRGRRTGIKMLRAKAESRIKKRDEGRRRRVTLTGCIPSILRPFEWLQSAWVWCRFYHRLKSSSGFTA